MSTQPPKFYKNPSVAVILSLFIPGVGQIYNGQFAKGFYFLISWTVSIAASIFISEHLHVTFWGGHTDSLAASIIFIFDTYERMIRCILISISTNADYDVLKPLFCDIFDESVLIATIALIVVTIAIPILWIYGMIDAYKSAQKINEKIAAE